MADKMILARIELDRDGGAYLDEDITLRDMFDRCYEAEKGGFGLDTPLKYGYVPGLLAGALYIEKPLDLTTLSFDELRRQVSLPGSMGAEKAEAAWNEIKRRLGED